MKKYVIFALLCSSSLMSAQTDIIYTGSSSQFFKNQTKEPTHKPSPGKIIVGTETKTSDNGKGSSLNFFKIYLLPHISRNPHHDGGRRAFVHKTPVFIVCAQQGLFDLELIKNRGVSQMEEVDFTRHALRYPHLLF